MEENLMEKSLVLEKLAIFYEWNKKKNKTETNQQLFWLIVALLCL